MFTYFSWNCLSGNHSRRIPIPHLTHEINYLLVNGYRKMKCFPQDSAIKSFPLLNILFELCFLAFPSHSWLLPHASFCHLVTLSCTYLNTMVCMHQSHEINGITAPLLTGSKGGRPGFHINELFTRNSSKQQGNVHLTPHHHECCIQLLWSCHWKSVQMDCKTDWSSMNCGRV